MTKINRQKNTNFDQNLLSALLDSDTLFGDYLKTLCDEIAAIDRRFEPKKNPDAVSLDFLTELTQNRFWPAVLILTEGTKKEPILASNTALGLSDSFEEIFETLKRTSYLLQHGIQVALDFSTLRAARSLIQGNHLQSVGPVKFMKLFENAPQNLNQITPLRFLLNIDHLDSEAYLDYILQAPSFIRFGIGLTSDFLEALKHNRDFTLRHKLGGEASEKKSAQHLFKKIAKILLKGIPLDFIFCEHVQAFKKAKQMDEASLLNTQNQMISPGEMVMTGVINLPQFLNEGQLDEKALKQSLSTAVHFLDNCFELNFYCDEQTKAISKEKRRIVLSVLGLVEYLKALNPHHEASKDKKNLYRLLELLNSELILASQSLGEKRGMKNKVFFKGKWHTARNSQLLGQIHTPLLSQIANMPAYFLKREMSLKDFMELSQHHLEWQIGLNNLASFKYPIKVLKLESFTKLLFQLYEAKALSFELN